MPANFDHRVFHRRRKLFKVIGLLLGLAGLFVLLNMMGELPEEPLKGTGAIFAGTVLILFGIIFLYQGYKLPLEDIPQKGLLRGQVGAVVESLALGVYEVGFSDDSGQTCAPLTLHSGQLIRLHHEPAIGQNGGRVIQRGIARL